MGHKNRLKAIMALNGDNLESLSNYLNISQTTLSKKINERATFGFTQPEIMKIKQRYNLKPNEIDTIFFTNSVS